MHIEEKMPVCIGKRVWFTKVTQFGWYSSTTKKLLAFSWKSSLKAKVWDGRSGLLRVPIACSRGAVSLIEVLATLPLQNTPILEKVQKDNEEKCSREWGKVAFLFFSGYYLLSPFQYYVRVMGIHRALCVNYFFGLCPRSLFFSENGSMLSKDDAHFQPSSSILSAVFRRLSWQAKLGLSHWKAGRGQRGQPGIGHRWLIASEPKWVH